MDAVEEAEEEESGELAAAEAASPDTASADVTVAIGAPCGREPRKSSGATPPSSRKDGHRIVVRAFRGDCRHGHPQGTTLQPPSPQLHQPQRRPLVQSPVPPPPSRPMPRMQCRSPLLPPRQRPRRRLSSQSSRSFSRRAHQRQERRARSARARPRSPLRRPLRQLRPQRRTRRQAAFTRRQPRAPSWLQLPQRRLRVVTAWSSSTPFDKLPGEQQFDLVSKKSRKRLGMASLYGWPRNWACLFLERVDSPRRLDRR